MRISHEDTGEIGQQREHNLGPQKCEQGRMAVRGLWSRAPYDTLMANGRLTGLEVPLAALAANCHGEKKRLKERYNGDSPSWGMQGRRGQEATTLYTFGYDPCTSSCVLYLNHLWMTLDALHM